ncbi:MAG: primosomal protein N' [Oxalicibacterium faecigallinarum]|uniref:primosomal protein N' n=1 Tax=Oxalicibacterium faecigallinarum TaxID=573741 RepID=UPI002809F711|nr:primosomal protein N' [Oxalicibacterium faecigallinarum]MDQ7968075.1 primosomal protein N' [Oxalicibacterium faecigallinarum]
MSECILKVALDSPLDISFDYLWQAEEGERPEIGQLVLVPFAHREVVGLIVGIETESDLPRDKLKAALAVRTQLPPLSPAWIALCRFAAEYYQRPLGEVALPGLPKNLRAVKTVSLDKAIKKLVKAGSAQTATAGDTPRLNDAQQTAATSLANTREFVPTLLYGVTGSGKTEVYLHAVAQVLAREKEDGIPAQVLILVPEINLTPQLEANVRQRFPEVMVATLHSGLAEGERLLHWMAAHNGQARIVLGTRLAILSSMPHLKMIIVDEEHDPSYKQQEGLRYSARDLAVWRAHQLNIPIVLGSATPSLETWQHVLSGRYRKLELRERAVQDAVLPKVGLIDLERKAPREVVTDGISASLLAAVRKRLERGEQSLLFLNRRGYAPVIHCDACGWISNCTRCSAFLVLHKRDRRLRCHHCGLEQRIPHACPDCGNVDLKPLGQGTQRVEETLHGIFPDARIMRIDADSTRLKGSAQQAFDAVHRGEVDILIGTQMVAKGHDFRNLTLVGVLNPDTALFSHDYRASERLFAQLMQVAGRAGRAAQKDGGNPAEVLIQTRFPHHPLFAAVRAHDYDTFAGELLEERRQANFPPFMYQALLRAEARELQTALDFLHAAAACIDHDGITVNDPIPMTMTRVANVDRAQLLVECPSRPVLQGFLKDWMAALRPMKTRVRWSLEVDPVDI